MLSSSSTNVEFYLPVGSPAGIVDLWVYGITLNPTMISVTPSVGSPAGSLLTAQVRGLGTGA